LNACVVAKGGHVYYTIHINCSVVLFYYFSLNGVTCGAFAWMFLSTPKSVGGVTAMLIAWKRWKLFIFW